MAENENQAGQAVKHYRVDAGAVQLHRQDPQSIDPLSDAEKARMMDVWLDAVVVVRASDQVIVHANPAVELLLGYAPDDLVGCSFFQLFADEGRDGALRVRHQQAFDQVLAAQRFRCRDGRIMNVDLIARLLYRNDERPEGDARVLIGLRDATERLRMEEERELLLEELRQALNTVRLLEGLLPICCGCKKIRDDEGEWAEVESYISDRSDVQFSHGLCPDCFDRMKGQI